MPFENEHSARLRPKTDFAEAPKWRDGKLGKHRRTKTRKVLGKTLPKQVSVIWGKLKRRAGIDDPPIPQAIRFPKETWTASEARKWLRDNKVRIVLFEAAG